MGRIHRGILSLKRFLSIDISISIDIDVSIFLEHIERRNSHKIPRGEVDNHLFNNETNYYTRKN